MIDGPVSNWGPESAAAAVSESAPQSTLGCFESFRAVRREVGGSVVLAARDAGWSLYEG